MTGGWNAAKRHLAKRRHGAGEVVAKRRFSHQPTGIGLACGSGGFVKMETRRGLAYQHRRATMRHTNTTRSLFIIFPRGPTSSLFGGGGGGVLVSHGDTRRRRHSCLCRVDYKWTNHCLLRLKPTLNVGCFFTLCGTFVRFLLCLNSNCCWGGVRLSVCSTPAPGLTNQITAVDWPTNHRCVQPLPVWLITSQLWIFWPITSVFNPLLRVWPIKSQMWIRRPIIGDVATPGQRKRPPPWDWGWASDCGAGTEPVTYILISKPLKHAILKWYCSNVWCQTLKYRWLTRKPLVW